MCSPEFSDTVTNNVFGNNDFCCYRSRRNRIIRVDEIVIIAVPSVVVLVIAARRVSGWATGPDHDTRSCHCEARQLIVAEHDTSQCILLTSLCRCAACAGKLTI